MAQKKHKGLPLYEAKMEGGKCRLLRVSLVDDPAVQSDFQAYAKAQQLRTYAVSDEDMRRVFGVVMRADFPIYRIDEYGEGYFITFSAETIRQYFEKYMADGRQNEVDLHHDLLSIEGATMVQAFFKDSARGIAPAGFEDIADGSLFAEYQITDEELWQRIKSGEFRGFSVEIIETDVPVMADNYHQHIMSTLTERMKAALAAGVAAFDAAVSRGMSYGTVSTDKGALLWDGDEDLKEGDAVYTEDAEGNRQAVEDGEYRTEDGKVIVVADGKVSEIKDAEAPEPEPDAQADADPAGDPAADVDALNARIAELEAAIEEKDAKIAELEAKLKEPAGEPAHDAFKRVKAENPFDIYKQFKK